MRQIHGLEKILEQHPERLNTPKLAEILLDDLQQCQCQIYGSQGEDKHVLLAQLHLLPETLAYQMFEQRIDLVVAGEILRGDRPPLTWRLQGRDFAATGRCSMIARVCGVDLYLQKSYTGKVGDIARQNFSFDVKALLKKL